MTTPLKTTASLPAGEVRKPRQDANDCSIPLRVTVIGEWDMTSTGGALVPATRDYEILRSGVAKAGRRAAASILSQYDSD